jgi:hypothetical protein
VAVVPEVTKSSFVFWFSVWARSQPNSFKDMCFELEICTAQCSG